MRDIFNFRAQQYTLGSIVRKLEALSVSKYLWDQHLFSPFRLELLKSFALGWKQNQKKKWLANRLRMHVCCKVSSFSVHHQSGQPANIWKLCSALSSFKRLNWIACMRWKDLPRMSDLTQHFATVEKVCFFVRCHQ